MTLTTEQIQELQALSDKATKGPWAQTLGYAVGGDEESGAYTPVAVTPCPKSPGGSARWTQWERDRAFIAASREALPALCADVLALRAEVARLREALGPFAKSAEPVLNPAFSDALGPAWHLSDTFRIEDLRRARTAMEGGE